MDEQLKVNVYNIGEHLTPHILPSLLGEHRLRTETHLGQWRGQLSEDNLVAVVAELPYDFFVDPNTARQYEDWFFSADERRIFGLFVSSFKPDTFNSRIDSKIFGNDRIHYFEFSASQGMPQVTKFLASRLF